MADTFTITSRPIVEDVNNLQFTAELIRALNRALVIENFHYLNRDQRAAFAFDLKTFWNEGPFVTEVGVWSDNNDLLQLNPDPFRSSEGTSIVWSNADLAAIFARGGAVLNLEFAPALIEKAVAHCYRNAAILQRLIVDLLDLWTLQSLTLDHLG